MKKLLNWPVYIVVGTMIYLTACDDANNPDPTDESELITTVNVKFTESGTTNTQTFTFRDPDGDGGQGPTKFDNVALKANTTYTVAIELLDESKSPVVNITNEIKEEQEEHLFTYTSNPINLLTYTYGDKDSRNFPVGLTGTARTGAAGTGKLNLRLRHQPPISGTPVKDGSPTPGSDDVNVDFNLTVQ